MNVPKTTCKQRHQDRQRAFIGAKMQSNLDKILEMRFDPTFTTDITTEALKDYRIVDSEWDRYQLHLQTKTTLLASIEGFSLLQDKIKSVSQGEEVPPANMIFVDIPTADSMHPSFVSMEHTHNSVLRNCVYSYPDQSSLDTLTAIIQHKGDEPFNRTVETTQTGEEIYTLPHLDEVVIQHRVEPNESLPSPEEDVPPMSQLIVTPQLLQHVGNVMVHSGHLNCTTAAALSAAIDLPLIAPICRRKRLRNMRVKVKTLVNDRLPQEVLDEEYAKKPRPIFATGAYYNACGAINKSTTLEWDILRLCPCAVLDFKDLCEAFKNQTFSKWFFQYYAMLRAALISYA